MHGTHCYVTQCTNRGTATLLTITISIILLLVVLQALVVGFISKHTRN